MYCYSPHKFYKAKLELVGELSSKAHNPNASPEERRQAARELERIEKEDSHDVAATSATSLGLIVFFLLIIVSIGAVGFMISPFIGCMVVLGLICLVSNALGELFD